MTFEVSLISIIKPRQLFLLTDSNNSNLNSNDNGDSVQLVTTR